MSLPERINVIKVVSYDVEKVILDILDNTEMSRNDIDMMDIYNHIEQWVENDFSCGHGHTADIGDLIWQDQDGNEVDW